MRTRRPTGVAALCLALAAGCSSSPDPTGGGLGTGEAVRTAAAASPGSPPGSPSPSPPGSARVGAPSPVATSPAAPSPPTASPDEPRQRAGDVRSRAVQPGWGPTRGEVRRARRLVSRLTLPQTAGQVIVARYDGVRAPTSLVNGLHLGGVIAFDDNITGTRQIRRSNRTLQQAAAHAGRRWPVFIGVDQEGGLVERVKGRLTRYPSFMTAGAARNPRLTNRAYAALGAELRNVGFTVDFAPDADVTSGPADPTIGSRSAGSRPRLVGRQAAAAAEGFLASGILPVTKHFPGHGSVPADSHEELPVQTKSLRRLMRSDLVPFRFAAERGLPAVMVGHIDVRAVDPRTPSSLSRKVVTGLLRKRLGFDGLVVTDALDMQAVAERFGSAESAVRAIRAGVDVLLMPPNPRAARHGLVRAVRQGRLPRSRLEQAATRQVALLLHQRQLEAQVTARPGTSTRMSRRLSAAGISVVSGPCRGRLVGRSVRAVGPAEEVARFRRAATRAGLRTGRGTTVALIGYGGAPRAADVVVSTDTPFVLGDSTGRTARIALYGDTPGAMRALVQVLLGRTRATGTLPVRVPGVPRTGCRD